MIKKLTGFIIAILFSGILVPALPAASQPFSFAVLGDSGGGDPVFKQIINDIRKDPDISFVVHTGDGVSTGTDAQYQHFLDMIAPLKNKWRQVYGNHEATSGGSQNYLKYFSKKYFNFSYGDCLFVAVDNARPESFDNTQYQWLKSLLEKERPNYQLVFLFFHVPLTDFTGANKYNIMEGTGQNLLQGLIKKYRVSYVFSGHIHGYGRREADGTVYIITGGAGSPLHLSMIGGGFHHYLKITVKDNRVSEKIFQIK